MKKAPRDALARRLGTTGSTLSALNSGAKLMTPKMAHRIALITGVSVLELGAPAEEADENGRLILDRLQLLEAAVLKTTQALERLTARLGQQGQRLGRLERQVAGLGAPGQKAEP